MALFNFLLAGAGTMVLLGTAVAAQLLEPGAKVEKDPKEQMLCRREIETGSLVKTKKTCHTRAQWEFIASENQRFARGLVDDTRTRSGGN